MKTLAEQFPDLSFAKEAGRWLELIKNKTIAEQLKERKINQVAIVHWLRCSGTLSAMDGHLVIWINKDDGREEQMLTLGHEVAHTFEFQDEKYYQYGITHPWPKEIYESVEKFCEIFTEKWITANGKEKVEEFLQTLEKS